MTEQHCDFVMIDWPPTLTGLETTKCQHYTRVLLGEVESLLPSIAGEIGEVSVICADKGFKTYEVVQSLACSFLAEFGEGVVLFFDHPTTAVTRPIADLQIVGSPRFAWCWCPDAHKLSIKLEGIFNRVRDGSVNAPTRIIIAKDALKI
jgi:hypothetical protein